jgi:hypothetical protein
MSDEEHSNTERWITIRKLAALDIVFHGPRLILAEFSLAVVLCIVLGMFSLVSFFRSTERPLFTALLSALLLSIALNYVPLLLYAIRIVRRNTAHQEVAFELEHQDASARKYAVQSVLLVLPLAVPILAISQEFRNRTRRDR